MTQNESAPRVVVMGVTGSGKTTVGTRLAAALGVPFAEGDDFHPAANIERMRAGIPLTDAERRPWLDRIAAWLAGASGGGVVSCSALARAYRDTLRAAAPDVLFVHLDVPRPVLDRRVRERRGHFMAPQLLDSQLALLEPLGPDEPGVVLDGTRPPEELVARARELMRTTPR
ncbi:gluconokinase [Nocardia farcinica]|uniref:gluconokinase n=1 Tax=Nocardia farcinica TaxID=37329 RepID=UPI000A37B3E6|nr:gluconokinase [Nocardia farcinica]SUE29086.1 gluconokinase [Nocardia farcinica]